MSEPVRKGTPAEGIIAEEERMLARVQARVALGDRERGPQVGAADFDEQLLTLRDAIGEAKPEDLAPLVEQMTRLAALRARVGGSRALPIDPASPYFAHMVLRENGKSRDVLVGKRGFIDKSSGVQIVDWRNAPISRIYYRYEEGDDYDEEIGGRSLEGILAVRRNISIHGGNLRRIGTPQGTFVRDSDGVWHEAVGQAAPVLQGGSGSASRAPAPLPPPPKGTLGVHHGPVQRADKHLPEIAALIDAEQFDLITRPESGLLVIQGGAGSGKTTVALHRIAYLAFGKGFKPRRVLFVVPSRALERYVADVLPSLGVQGVPVVTYEGWAAKLRLKLVPRAGGKYNDDTPDTVSRLKKHPALLAVLEEWVAERAAAVDAELTEGLARLELGEAVLAQWRAAERRPLVPRLRFLLTWLRGEPQGLPVATRAAAESLVNRLGKRSAAVYRQWGELMTDRPRLRAAYDRWGDVGERQLDKLIAWCARQQESKEDALDSDGNPIATADGRSLEEDDPRGRLDREDDVLMLRLVQLLRGGLASRDGKRYEYDHVAVDEAQDRSAMEIKVLLEATAMKTDDPSSRSVTIAGDTAQRLVFDNNFDGWERLLEETGHAGAVVSKLELSYRSTAEVMQLARDVLGPDLAPAGPVVARNGAPVELHEFGDLGEAVAFLADSLRSLSAREPTASVALIARYPEQAEVYYQGLERAEVPALRRVKKQDFSFAAGIDVTDVTQVKGLEFDYVVMLDVNASSYPDSVEARHMFHIAATRAAHQLWLVSTGAPSPLLPAYVRVA